MKKILVIKHGSLGDIIFALPSMISIRTEFPDALVYLLTEEKYVSLLMKPKIFDKKYVSNGYFYTYDDNWSSPNQITTIEGTGYYPQAGINFLIGLTTSF